MSIVAMAQESSEGASHLDEPATINESSEGAHILMNRQPSVNLLNAHTHVAPVTAAAYIVMHM